jgi:hypothetical protein
MSARTPRRAFLAPFVVTTAALAPTAGAAPPPPHHNPPAHEGATTAASWLVRKQGASCQAARECPPATDAKGARAAATCSTAPAPYACPPDLGTRTSVHVTRYAGREYCYSEPPTIQCHPNATCNPPEPTLVPCPDAP